jgi:GDP-L-fucose synthase
MDTTSTILITGGSGMIGSSLIRLLNAKGYNRVLAPAHKELDLRDQKAVSDYMRTHRPQAVFHLAARVGGIHANSTYPAQFIYDNTAMHTNVIEAAYRNDVAKLLFPGSACTYPKFAPQPVTESEFLNGQIEPTNLAYACAKINGLVMAQSYAREYGMKVVLPMPTNTYGSGDNFDPNASHVIPALMKRFHEAKLNHTPEVVLWGTGSPLREFINADDVAKAFLFLMLNYDSHELINVGSMQEISIRALAEKVAAVVGYKGTLTNDTSKPDGAPRKMLDSAKLFALGWKPEINIEDGLSRMYQHHFLQSAAA